MNQNARIYRNGFQIELQHSNSSTVTEWWSTAHRHAFRGFVSMTDVDDVTTQKKGIDRVVQLQDRTVTVEEKLDYTRFLNVAFEVWSTNKVAAGWAMKDLAADVLAYGFKAAQTVYYFKTAELLDVFRSHQTQWTCQFGERTVFASRAVILPVPIPVVLDAVPHYKQIHLN